MRRIIAVLILRNMEKNAVNVRRSVGNAVMRN
jgi:hypothetical protein